MAILSDQIDKEIATQLEFRLEKWVSKSFYVKDLDAIRESNEKKQN